MDEKDAPEENIGGLADPGNKRAVPGEPEDPLALFGVIIIIGGVISYFLSHVVNPVGKGILIGFGLLTFSIQRIEVIQPLWASTLILAGLLILFIKRRGMYFLVAAIFVTAGLMNLFGGKFTGWTLYGILQLLLSLLVIGLFRVSQKASTGSQVEEPKILEVPAKQVAEPIVPIPTPSDSETIQLSQKTETPAKRVRPDAPIRVFISSTFSDMQAERDELAKFIFPQLRKLCEQRGTSWGEVDLRWGITDEQKSEGKVLPICLEEIQRCRPYFVGILGERYGWIPDEIPQELIEREPWLKEHSDHSVTELEILHGVLNNPDMAEHAFFYFRDPAYINTLPSEQQPAYIEGVSTAEIMRYGPAEAQKRAERRSRQLLELKERIRGSGFPLVENYKNPKELGQRVLKDLTAVINDLYPEGTQPDYLDREKADHEAFAMSRAQVYIDRRDYFDQLDAHVRSEGKLLTVVGEAGSGKSALLANWAMRYRASHPDDFVLMHFIGATPESSDWAAMLRRILGELKRRFDIYGEIPDQQDALCTTFADWLGLAASRGKVVLIFDALNQLEDRNGAPDLVWLPSTFPKNVSVFLSTLPGRPLDELKKRNTPFLTVDALLPEEREQLIKKYLALFTKTLDAANTGRIASAPQSKNPLFLRVLLDELRLVGMHERLNEQIELYLKAENISTLYELILDRCEQDYGKERPGLLRDALSLLWAARHGLSETELLELLGVNGQPLPQAYWSPLYLSLEQSFLNRGGLISFSHDYLRQAVQNRYLTDQSAQRSAHLYLADYFESLSVQSQRRLDELPWQFARAGEWQRLFMLLGDLQFFEALWKFNSFEEQSYWAQLEANSPYRMVNAYRKLIDHPFGFLREYVWHLSSLLNESGHTKEALALRTYLVRFYRITGDKVNLGTSLGNQAMILADRGDLNKAMALHKEEERIFREVGDKDGLQRALSGQGNIYYQRGDLDKAMALYREQESICCELGDKNGQGISLGNQAQILHDHGDMDGAMELRKKEERISREVGDKAELHRALCGQANILLDLGELDRAMALYKEQESICRELGDRDGLGISLGNQALILHAWGDLDGALTLDKEEERISREVSNKGGIIRSLLSQAAILKDRGDLEKSMELYRDGEQICRELGDKALLTALLGGQANIFYHRGDYENSMLLHKEEESLCRELELKDNLALCLGNQGVIWEHRGDWDRALTLYREEERICRELGNKSLLQASLGNQGILLYHRGDMDRAMALYKEQEKICRELGDLDGLGLTLGNEALLLADLGHLQEAKALHKEEEKIYLELGDKAGLGLSYGNQALISYDLGDLEGAMVLHKKEEQICRELGDKDGLQRSLDNQGNIVKKQGDLKGAMSLYRESERICREIGERQSLGIALGNQALILDQRNDVKGAMKLHQEEERIYRELGDKEGLQRCLGNEALLYSDLGDLKTAMSLLKEQAHLCDELGSPESTAISLKNRAIVLAKMNKKGEARRLAKESLKIAEECGYHSLIEQVKSIKNRYGI